MASVLVVGTKVGVTTNSKGDFTIKVPAGKSQLLIRFVSYKSQTVAAKDGMVVKLQPEATTLDNVVVTGMVATDKRLFTGASDKLKADQVKMAGMADISRGLKGSPQGSPCRTSQGPSVQLLRSVCVGRPRSWVVQPSGSSTGSSRRMS